jgi:O-antigen ligase
MNDRAERDLVKTRREPGPTPGPSEIPQYTYGWLTYLAGGLLALLVAFVVFKLQYSYGQAPHRIVKMLIGLVVVAVVLVRPRLSLHVWLLAIPIGEYLPSTGIPGVNGPNLVFLIILLNWIVPRVIRHERVFARTRLAAPVAAYIALSIFAYLRAVLFPPGGASYDSVEMLKVLWQSLLGFGVYFAVANMVGDERQQRNLLVTMAIGVGFAAIVALRQYATTPAHRRIAGTIGDVNDLGAYFAMCASFLAVFLFSGRVFALWKRLAVQAGAALSVVGVFLPKSRGALVAAACGLGFLTYRVSKKAFIAFLIILAASPIWAPAFVKERVEETTADSFEAEMVGDASDRLDPSSAVRLEIWASALRAFAASPLIGYGYRTTPYLTYEDLGRPFSAHSLYVQTAAETGVVGLAVLAWLLVACAASGRELLRRATLRLHRSLAVGFLAATVALVIANIFGQRFSHMSIAGTYFFLAGLVDRSIRVERNVRSQDAEKGVAAS